MGLPGQFLESTRDIRVPQSNSPEVRTFRWFTTDPTSVPEILNLLLITALPHLPVYINTAYLHKQLPTYIKPACPKSSFASDSLKVISLLSSLEDLTF